MVQVNQTLKAAAKRGRKPTGKPPSARASISLPPEIYSTLQALAKEKRVSVAWVMRDAAERYIRDQWPLLSEQGPEGAAA